MNKILHIDTSNNKKIEVSLEIDGKKDVINREMTGWSSQILLPLIGEILKKHNLKTENLTGITVHTGPGSFTGLRVGISAANTLGWLLGISVNGKKDGIVIPEY